MRDETRFQLFTISSFLDFSTLIEAGLRLPIAFSSNEALTKWATTEQDLESLPLGRRSMDNVIVFSGVVQGGPQNAPRYYTQIWVRAAYKSYRRAMDDYFVQRTGKRPKIDRHDVDHAVSRKTLRGSWPNAWVNVLYVGSGVNRSIGSMMERSSTIDMASSDRILMNAECFLKIYLKRQGKLTSALIDTYLGEAAESCLIMDAKNPAEIEMAINAQATVHEIKEEYRKRP